MLLRLGCNSQAMKRPAAFKNSSAFDKFCTGSNKMTSIIIPRFKFSRSRSKHKSRPHTIFLEPPLLTNPAYGDSWVREKPYGELSIQAFLGRCPASRPSSTHFAELYNVTLFHWRIILLCWNSLVTIIILGPISPKQRIGVLANGQGNHRGILFWPTWEREFWACLLLFLAT